MLTEALHHHDRHLPIGYLPLSTQPCVCTHLQPSPLPLQSQPALKMATAEFISLKLKLMADILLGLLFLLAS